MNSVEEELALRKRMWQQVLAEGGPKGVEPKLLRQLGIYGGAQGIWVDKARTASLTENGNGVTVGLLHTGVHYDDDMTESGVLYHYPETGRPPARDKAEVDATKACKVHRLPVFVMHKRGSLRDVFFGWVEDWDDQFAEFLITFGANPPLPAPASDDGFELMAKDRSRKTRETAARMNQNRFKFQVLARYEPSCAVCSIAAPEVLEAAHVFEVKHGGTDHPANGLVLCATHHRAFDRKLFAIEPESTRLIYRHDGPTKDDLRITRDDLRHLRNQPHSEALRARFAKGSDYFGDAG